MNFFVGEDAASQPGPGTCSALKNFVGKSAKKKTVGCSIPCVYMDVIPELPLPSTGYHGPERQGTAPQHGASLHESVRSWLIRGDTVYLSGQTYPSALGEQEDCSQDTRTVAGQTTVILERIDNLLRQPARTRPSCWRLMCG